MKKYLITIFLVINIGVAQDNTEDKKEKLKFLFEPDSLSLNIGEEASVLIRLVDSKGNQVKSSFMIRGQRKSLDVKPRISDSTGVAKVSIKVFDAGKLNLRAIAYDESERTVGTMKVNVPLPPLEKITFVDPTKKVFVGTAVNYAVEVYDKAKILRDNSKVVFTSKNSKVAEFDNFGNLIIKKSGKTTITAKIDDLEESLVVSAKKNPARKIKLDISENEIRTGDVIKLNALVLDGGNKVLDNIPITYSYSGKSIYQTDSFINNQSTESIGRPASG